MMITDQLFGTALLSFDKENAPEVFALLALRQIPFTGSRITGERCELKLPLYRLRETVSIHDVVTIEIKGLPRLFLRYKKRWGIFCGLLIFALIVHISGSVIWSVDVTGNHVIPDAYITENLSKSGCSVGTPIRSIDFDTVNNKFLINCEGIAWISVNMNGTHANVEVRESRRGRESADDKIYNLVASEDGQVERLAQTEGKPQVKLNDAVSKGDILVSGVIVHNENRLRFESAEGCVFANVTRTFDINVPYKYKIKVETGRITEKYSVGFFKNNINLYGNYGIPYRFYDTIVSENRADIGGVMLPLSLTRTKYLEYETVDAVYTESEARSRLMSEYRKKLRETLGDAELLHKTVNITEDKECLKLRCELYCLANIAAKREIKINDKERAEEIVTENGKDPE